MSTHGGGAADDYWRRPEPPGAAPADDGQGGRGAEARSETPGAGAAGPRDEPPADVATTYTGPPPTQAPPRHWRPPVVVQPAPPRELPAQDHPEIDGTEREARTLTLGVGMIAGAVLIVLLFVLCSRILF